MAEITVDDLLREKQRRQAAAASAPQEKGFFDNLTDSAVLGLKKRALGVTELGANVRELLGQDPKFDRQAAADLAAEYERQGTGTGVTGFVGEVLGDPLTYLSGGIFGKGASIPQMAGQGLGLGSAMGLSQTTKDPSKSDITDNLTNAGIYGVTGAVAAPIAGKVVQYGTDAIKGVADDIGRIFSDNKAQQKAYKILAKRLADEGYQPGQVQSMLADVKATGINPTLGEATGSSGVLQAEKSVLRGTGKGANIMRESLADRARNEIPAALEKQAQGLRVPREVLNDVYGQAGQFAEGQNLNIVTDDAIANIQRRLAELGDVNNVEKRALQQGMSILENAQKRGNTFESLLDAKRQLSDLFIENADLNAQKNAQRFVAQYAKQLGDTLDVAGGEAYGAANRLAQQNMAGRDLQDAIASTREGGLGQLYNKIWATPEQRTDFLRKLPNDATKREFENFFEALDKVRRGFGGSDTAFNIPAGNQLSIEAGTGLKPQSFSPMNIGSSMIESLNDKLKGRTFEQIAKATLNPDKEMLTNAILRQQGITPSAGQRAGQAVAKPAAVAAGKRAETSGTQARVLARTGGAAAALTPTAAIPFTREDLERERARRQQQSSLSGSIINAESGGNPTAKNPNSSAYGPGQFIDSTWKSMVKKYGQQYGITEDMRTNPEANAVMVELLAAEHAPQLQQVLGREPTQGELYLAHFAGAGGAKRLLKIKNKGAPAATLLPTSARANKAIFYDGKRPRTVREVIDLIAAKV